MSTSGLERGHRALRAVWRALKPSLPRLRALGRRSRLVSPSETTALRLTMLVGLWAAMACRPTTACAAGAAVAPRGHDLILAIDARWTGCTAGGYWPIRIR